MYAVLKSQKKTLSHNRSSCVYFCEFLTNNLILVIYQTNAFEVVKLNWTKQQKMSIGGGLLEAKGLPLDCKRVKEGSCALIFSDFQDIILLQLVNNEVKASKVANVLANVGLVSVQATITHTLMPFQDGDFVIYSIIPEQEMYYLSIFNLMPEGKYSSIVKQAFYESSNPRLDQLCICPLEKEVAVYKQSFTKQGEWTIKMHPCVANSDESVEKQIMLPDFLNENTQILSMVERDHNEYLFFMRKLNSPLSPLEIYWCKLIKQKKLFTQVFEALPNFQYHNPLMQEIIYIDHSAQLAYIKSFAFIRYDDELYTHFLEMVDLSSGKTVEKGYCSLKMLSVSPNGRYIIDYSQQLEKGEQWIFHVRLVLDKKNLYMFMMQNSEILEMEKKSDGFRQTILSML